MKIIITSTNPVKVNAALVGFSKMFPHEAFTHEMVSVPSGVSDQPMSNEETLLGATNRVRTAAQQFPDADYWIGIEGGIESHESKLYCTAWAVVRDKSGKMGKGKAGAFVLPQKMTDLIHQGVELGTAHDIVMQGENTKQKNGTVGALTNDVIDRTAFYVPAMIFALIPFAQKDLFE